jgi:DNA (cytosine-5)-methyltransferase 1
MALTFGSLFAGIGGFDLALTRAGLTGAYAAEIDAKCNSVRRRHWPDEMQYEDVAFVRRQHRPDVVCAGWPCQGNSVAGKRAGMADSRSGLWGEVVRVLDLQRPRWFLGENVPGILSVNGGEDWATVLADLGRLGYGFAYRILDAQWFGVPQRRRRVFIVGCLGDWRRAGEILFERESLPWDSPPSREAGARVAHCIARGVGSSGYRYDANGEDFVTGTLCNNGKASGSATQQDAEAGMLVPMAFAQNQRDELRNLNGVAGALSAEPGMKQQTYVYQCQGSNVGPMGALRVGNQNESGGVPFTLAIAYRTSGNSGVMTQGDKTAALNCQSDPTEQIIQNQFGVRRLMPIECERLQGFPDDWTRYGADGEEMADSVRYRMCGNAVAVPCVEWIGRRLMEATSL